MSYAENLQNEFFLELGQLTSQHTELLIPSFNNLPTNNYLDGQFRLRRYSHFLFDGATIKRLPTKSFVQTSDINNYQGDLERIYAEIEQSVVDSDAFIEMFKQFKHIGSVSDATPIEVHQMRILAKDMPADTAPEGVHQDGYDRLGLFIVKRENITGGEINVHLNKTSSAFVTHSFDHGEFLVLNDRRFFHSAAPIVPLNQTVGYMDLFVLIA